MGDGDGYLNPPPLRFGGSKGRAAVVGEIVEVQGGHIVRSTGRKDRHSKVCTAKGPRDRRVRLAAHTAIQFYDVQDRLGYDRPSKAVDWLIKKAKAAIDELAELPAWHPTATATASSAPDVGLEPENAQNMMISDAFGSSSKRAMGMLGGGNEQVSGGFLPTSFDSDVIGDTMKSFFPMGGVTGAGGGGETSSSAMQFQSFPTNNLFSRNNYSRQDLRLSLQSFQDANFLHPHTPPPPPPPANANPSPHHHLEQPTRSEGQQHVLLTGIPLGFDGWQPLPEQHQQAPELGRFSSWSSGSSVPAGFSFGSPHVLGGGQNQFLTTTQRGPLQSSNTPLVRAWMEPPAAAMAEHHHNLGAVPMYPPSSFFGGIGFSGYGGFSGFHIPARIQGDKEEHDGYSDKPSSASSGSHH